MISRPMASTPINADVLLARKRMRDQALAQGRWWIAYPFSVEGIMGFLDALSEEHAWGACYAAARPEDLTGGLAVEAGTEGGTFTPHVVEAAQLITGRGHHPAGVWEQLKERIVAWSAAIEARGDCMMAFHMNVGAMSRLWGPDRAPIYKLDTVFAVLRPVKQENADG